MNLEYKNNSSKVLFAKVLSPLHIGGASEKHAKAGVDFIMIGNQVNWIDQNKLMLALLKNNKIDEYSYDISEGKHINLRDYAVNLNEVVNNKTTVSGVSDEIHRFINNGLGNKIVPGSSVKGSIRSVFVKKLKKAGKFVNETEIFGKIDNNMMRYLQIADANLEANDLTLYTTKIMSRGNAPANAITWKDKRKGSKSEFDATSFVTNYECIKPDTIFNFRLTIADELFNFTKEKLGKNIPPNIDALIMTNSLENLLKNIDEHTRAHIKKEIDFFKYKQTEKSRLVVAFFEKILKNENGFLMRLASGSGFHAISGDWKYEEHINSLTTGKDGDKNNLRYKTRRLAIIENDLLPMGFIRLFLEEPKEEEIIEETQVKEIPAYYTGAIKQGAKVFAELVKIEGSRKTFKLLINEKGNEELVVLNYNAPMLLNSMHKVEIGSIQKTKSGFQIQTINYKYQV